MNLGRAWMAAAALMLLACDKPASSDTDPTPMTAGKPAVPRTLEQRLADYLAEAALMGEERINLEAALRTKLWEAPHMQLLADFHATLLEAGASRSPLEAHAALVKKMAPPGTADRAIDEFVKRHFTTCTTMRFEPGRGTYTVCQTGERTAAADPTAGATAYIRDVMPSIARLADIQARQKTFEAEFLPLVEQHFGKKKEELNERVMMEGLFPLVEKHRPEVYEKLTGMVKGIKAETTNHNQDYARRELHEIHGDQIRHFVRDGDLNGVRDYWVADAYRLSRFAEWKPETDPRDGGVYQFAAVAKDAKDEPYGRDTDKSGNAWRNSSGYALCAFPSEYPGKGRQTYLMNESGVIWCKDTGGRRVERFPSDLEGDGWSIAAKPPADHDIAIELFRYGLESGSDPVCREGLAMMRTRGEDVKLFLLTVMKQGDAVSRRVAPIMGADFAGSEDALLLEQLEARCEEVPEGIELVQAIQAIGPDAWPVSRARLMDRVLSLPEEGRARTLYSVLRVALSEEELLELSRRAAAKLEEAKAERILLLCEIILATETGPEARAKLHRARARVRVAQGRRDEAAAELREARALASAPDAESRALEDQFPELTPPRSEAHQRMTKLMEDGDESGAADVAREAAGQPGEHTKEDRRDFARTLVAHGRTLAAKNDIMAESAFGEALQLDPDCAEAHLERGLLDIRDSIVQLDLLIADVRAVKRLNPKLLERHAGAFATAFARQAQWLKDEQGVELMKLAEELNPTCAALWLARARQEEKYSEAALSALEKAAECGKTETDAALRRDCGLELITEATWMSKDRAKKLMALAFELFDTPPPAAYEGRGYWRIRIGDHAGAEADYRAAGKLDELAATYARMAGQATNKFAKAMAQGRAHALRPDGYAAPESFTAKEWGNHAESCVPARYWIEAIGAYDEAIKLEPKTASLHAARAGCLSQTEDLAEAERGLTRAIELDPRTSLYWSMRGSLRHRRGDEAGAIGDYDEVVRLDPADPTVYMLRGYMHHVCSHWKEAAADYAMHVEKAAKPVFPVEVYRWVVRTRAGDGAKATETLAAAYKDGGDGLNFVELLLDRRREEDLLKEDLQFNAKVLAKYLAAEKRLSKGDRAGALKLFQECLEAKTPMWPDRFLKAQIDALSK